MLKRVGVLGGGQLAQMLALAANPLGIETHSLSAHTNVPVTGIGHLLQGELDDTSAIKQLIANTDVITLESENTPKDSAALISEHHKLAPSLHALLTTQDRALEKKCFDDLEIPCAPYAIVDNAEQLSDAIKHIGLPAILKTRRFGYDGKGQWLLQSNNDVQALLANFPQADLILEGFVDFSGEVSQIAVRNRTGECRYYPLIHNQHQNGILRISRSPYINDILARQARGFAERLLTHFNYVGVLTIEFFICGNKLIANEMAPRVHNSGHLTIEGNVTSQFANHLRAVCDLPLGSCEARDNSVMINCISHSPAINDVLKVRYANYHQYHKAPRPGRKLGHITINHADLSILESQVNAILAIMPT